MESVEMKRIWGRVPVKTYEEIERLANSSGMSVAQFSGQLVYLGLKQYYRMYEPEKAISPEFMAEIVKVLSGMGVEVSELSALPPTNGKHKSKSEMA